MTQRAELNGSKRSYRHPCLIAQALNVLGDRWTLIILRDLMSGLQHFGDILDNSDGLSPNVLSTRLKHLEQEGLVERHYHRGLPPRVEYTLTEKGWAVRPILLSLIQWSDTYLDGINPADVGDVVSTDFAVRVLPAFSFEPERAQGFQGSMLIELTDCADCNQWTYTVSGGRFLPRRECDGPVDVTLRTTVEGFFRFLRRERPPEECGELHGDRSVAATLQECFCAV
jgi:DNA-binding HxlR family transcriptional regulator